ncbi:roadblock/LC7 domain-containing protein [Streptomyces sp. NPDC002790]|uniref:roadblock/LC7 domain-containing protein n=1 Tax=Streptomyces sp. NPDC002790 TaxID=3154431 RepID=UPI00332EC370
MLDDIVKNVVGARHAVLLSADGLPRASTEGLAEGDLRTISTAMSGIQALSRATAPFVGTAANAAWTQTVIEFGHGWIFLIGAGQGAYLAAAAEPDVDMQQISYRMHRLVARLGHNMTSAPRVEGAGQGGRHGSPEPAPGEDTAEVLRELDQAVAGVNGARHAVLLGGNGLPRGATAGLPRDLADRICAAMTGIHANSRAAAQFAGPVANVVWQQTAIEFQHGWILLIAAGDGALLAASADHDCNIEALTARLHEVEPKIAASAVAGRVPGNA